LQFEMLNLKEILS